MLRKKSIKVGLQVLRRCSRSHGFQVPAQGRQVPLRASGTKGSLSGAGGAGSYPGLECRVSPLSGALKAVLALLWSCALTGI